MARYPSGATPYDPARLAALVASLERTGVAFLLGAEGGRLARSQGGGALYMPTEPGRPGIVVLGEHPTCAEVIEELIDLGQHRRSGWRDLSGQIPALEGEAQRRLLRLATRWGWPREECE